jgi:hypothetical protein
MTEVSFTGDLNYVTYLIEKYKKDGYVYKEGTESKGNPIIYRIVMRKAETVSLYSGDTKIAELTLSSLSTVVTERSWKPLAEQLTEAVEREDYETAAILRDKINKK